MHSRHSNWDDDDDDDDDATAAGDDHDADDDDNEDLSRDALVAAGFGGLDA